MIAGQALFPSSEKGRFAYSEKNTGVERSRASYVFEKVQESPHALFKFTSRGQGHYDEYEDIVWHLTVDLEEKDGYLYPLYSLRTITNSAGSINVEIEKKFDYAAKKIFYSLTDRNTDTQKRKTLPVKGKTIDSAAMVHALLPFIAGDSARRKETFYLVSEKAKLYKITLKFLPSETIETSSGAKEALKIRLVPNLGPLTGIIGALIPPTYVWYTKEKPHMWLQYEGLETGLGSRHVFARSTSLGKLSK